MYMGKLPNFHYIGKVFLAGALKGNFKQFSSSDTDSKR